MMTRQQAIDLDNDIKFIALKKEMDKVIEMENAKLLRCGLDEVIRYQERIKALSFCMRFPQIVAEREEDNEPSIITPGIPGKKA